MSRWTCQIIIKKINKKIKFKKKLKKKEKSSRKQIARFQEGRSGYTKHRYFLFRPYKSFILMNINTFLSENAPRSSGLIV